jgi:hypothetical protein
LNLKASVPYLAGNLTVKVSLDGVTKDVEITPGKDSYTLDLAESKLPLNKALTVKIVGEKILDKSFTFTPLVAAETLAGGTLVPGDLNADNVIDKSDQEELTRAIEAQTTDGDLNLDGVTNSFDWAILTTFMGQKGN